MAYVDSPTWRLDWLTVIWRLCRGLFTKAYHVCRRLLGHSGILPRRRCPSPFIPLCWTILYRTRRWHFVCNWVSYPFEYSDQSKRSTNHHARPLYNSELAPPEVRGFLIALQQLSTTIGIFLAYWSGVSDSTCIFHRHRLTTRSMAPTILEEPEPDRPIWLGGHQ